MATSYTPGGVNTSYADLANSGLTYSSPKDAKPIAQGAVKQTGNPYYSTSNPTTGATVLQPQYTTASGQGVNSLAATGGAPSGGGPAPTNEPPQEDPTQRLINEAYNSLMSYLGEAENTIRGQQPGIVSGINQSFDTSAGNVRRTAEAGQAQIDQSQKQGEGRRQDALTAAVRLYNDLTMGGQQRFGGASSAGEAYAALTGRELQRNQAQIGKNFEDFMGNITMARNNLQTQLTNAIAELESKRQTALGEAERTYQNQLLEITRNKSLAGQQKAEAQLSALQNFRNNVFNVQLAQASAKQNLGAIAQQAEAQYNNFVASAGQQTGSATTATNTFGANTTTNPNSGLAFNPNQAPASNQFAFTGQIDPTQQDQLAPTQFQFRA